ncbi:CHRD domain-containing protein [Streptomyces lydicus]|uniref:CHRD domain-containing protein n=1 Tax=Streptomyces lydicus TaxID=47763 RepID=UPI0036E1A653
MLKRILVAPLTLVLLGAAAATGQATASAHDAHGTHGAASDMSNMQGMQGMNGTSARTGTATTVLSQSDRSARAEYFVARLKGTNEVPVAGGPAVGDKDGRAVAVIKVKGSVVSYAFAWKGITAPTLAHIHQGKAGVNGPVKVGLIGTALPDTSTAAAGAVNSTDTATLAALEKDPSAFYVNLHSTAFPGGAVRGQFSALQRPVDLLGVVNPGGEHAFMDGGQEVPVAGKPAVGDPDGFASAFIKARGSEVDYSFVWVGIGSPTLGHIHQGKAGVNGDVKVPLFMTPVPDGVFALSGSVTGVDRTLVGQIRNHPGGFYANLHSAEFPGGAVRGQLSRTPRWSGE